MKAFGLICIITLVVMVARKIYCDITGVIRFWYTNTGQVLQILTIITLVVGIISFFVL